MRRPLPGWARWLLLILVIIILALGVYANYQFAIRVPGGNDFLARWMGAKSWLVDGINPYDPEVSLRTQEVIYGRPARPEDGEDVAHFVYPLPVMLFVGPFGLIPYTEARAIWMTLLEVALFGLTILGVRLTKWRPTVWMLAVLLIFSVAWYHGFRALILGQFAIIEALLIVGAIFAIQKEQDGIAGILLALSIAKPQMPFLLIIFVLIWAISKRRWSLIISTMVSFGIIIGLSLFIMPDWPLRWIRQVVSYPDYTNTKPVVGIIADLFPAFSQWINIGLTLLVILYLIWEWILALGKDDSWFQWTAAMTLLLTNIIVVRTATTNYLSMVPGLILVFSIWVSRWNRRGRLAVLGVLALFFVVLWILFLSTVDGNLESPVMYLPFPIVLLFFLWWIRWWATRPTKLPLEKDYVIGVNP